MDVLKVMQNSVYSIWIKLLLVVRPLIRKNENEIVFIADYLKPRIHKMGYALRRKGYRVVLLLDEMGAGNFANVDMECFDKVVVFRSKEDVFLKCLCFKPLVYHLFSEANVKDYSQYLISKKLLVGKFVYDQYDVFKGLSRFKNATIESREKYCFENADGICCRSFETQYLKHKYNYHFSGKRILFLDYCWNRYRFEPKNQDENDSLKFVYGGRLLSPRTRDVLETIEWEGFQYIANEAVKQNNYFVIIPSQAYERKDMIRFISLSNSNSHVKIKKPMSFKKLINYENTMDYGIDCAEFQSKMDDYERQFGYIYDYRAKARYYATNKFFDYIDAEIPALYGRKDEMFGKYLEKYGGAIPCSLEELPMKMEQLKKDRNINKQKVREAKEFLSIDNQIGRLITFYDEIYGG